MSRPSEQMVDALDGVMGELDEGIDMVVATPPQRETTVFVVRVKQSMPAAMGRRILRRVQDIFRDEYGIDPEDEAEEIFYGDDV